MSNTLTREGLLKQKPKVQAVELSSGQTAYVRQVSAQDSSRLSEDEKPNIPHQVAMVLCGPDGVLLFDPDNPEDVRLCGDAIPLADADALLTASAKLTTDPADIKKKSKQTPNTPSASG